MSLAQGDDDPLIRRGSLQLEVERRAKSFAERQSPGAVETTAKRRVQDQLHPAAFVEEPFGNNPLLSRHCSQYCTTGCDIGHSLFRAPPVQTTLRLKPADS